MSSLTSSAPLPILALSSVALSRNIDPQCIAKGSQRGGFSCGAQARMDLGC